MSQSKSSNGAGQPVTIFVVDDEQMLLDLAAAILQPLGYNVRTFSDPRMALKEFPAAKPVVIVTDYAMGEMNGLDLVRECRRANPAAKNNPAQRHRGREHFCGPAAKAGSVHGQAVPDS